MGFLVRDTKICTNENFPLYNIYAVQLSLLPFLYTLGVMNIYIYIHNVHIHTNAKRED